MYTHTHTVIAYNSVKHSHLFCKFTLTHAHSALCEQSVKRTDRAWVAYLLVHESRVGHNECVFSPKKKGYKNTYCISVFLFSISSSSSRVSLFSLCPAPTLHTLSRTRTHPLSLFLSLSLSLSHLSPYRSFRSVIHVFTFCRSHATISNGSPHTCTKDT